MTPEAVGNLNDSLGNDFVDFIVELNANNVDYVLVGGYAVGAYGVVRATTAIDFLYRRTSENVARLCAALVRFGAPDVVIVPEDLAKPDMVSTFGAPPDRIDLLSSISGVDFDAVWAGSSKLELDGVELRVIGLAETSPIVADATTTTPTLSSAASRYTVPPTPAGSS